MEEKAIRGVPWTMLSFASTKAVTVLTTIVLARLLAPADFGLMALAQIAISFLNWFAGISYSGTLVVRQDLDARGRGTILTIMLISATLTAGVALALAPLAADAFHQPRLTGVMGGFSAVLLVGGIASYYEATLTRELEFRRRFIALVVQSATTAVVSITLAVLGAGVWSLVFGQLVSRAAYGAMLFGFAPERVRPAFDRHAAVSVLRTGRGFLVQGITVFVRQNADSVAVGRLLGATSLGFYSMASKLGDLTYWTIADPVARVTFPAFARSRARDEDIRPAFLSVIRLVALVGVFAGIVLSGAADPLTRAVFGPKWLPMIGPLTVLGIWAALRPVDATLSWLLNSIQRAGLVGWVSIVILVPLVPGFLFAAHFRTMEALACVTLADTTLSLLMLSVLVCRHLELPARDLWRALRPVALAAPPAWAAMYGLGHALQSINPIPALAASLLVGVLAYAATLSWVEPGLLMHVRWQVLRTLGRAPAVPAAS